MFNADGLAPISNHGSCTSEIFEYEAKVPVLELGVSNTVLRIIDTPGFGDTRNAVADAQLIATLKEFLESHEDFKHGQFPTVVLIVASFADTRFDGENAAFVKMLKGLRSIEENIIDKEKSNVILLLTHVMAEKPAVQKNPEKKCEMFANVVRQFIQLPMPIVTVLAENEAQGYKLKKTNGYFELPNGKYYPYNIYEAIRSLTSASRDKMGEAIVRTAFKDIKKYTVEKNRVKKLLPVGLESVNVAQNIIDKIQYQISSCPVMDNLEKCWENMNSCIRDDNPGTLLCMQRVFERKKIYTMEDLPKTENDILSLMKEIPTNYAVPALLEQALGIKVPKLNISLVTGHCYNIIQDCTLPVSIFKLETNYTLSPIGYLIPSEIKCELNSETLDICKFISSRAEYIRSRLKDLNISANIHVDASVFDSEVRSGAGYNYINKNTGLNTHTKFNMLREYRKFRLTLAKNTDLSEEFISAVKDLPKFTGDESESVNKFKVFFQRFGTHVVTSCFGGGAIQITGSAETENTLKSEQDRRAFIAQLRIDFTKKFGVHTDSTYTNDYQNQSTTHLSNLKYSLNFKGGDWPYHHQNLTDSSDGAPDHVEKWNQSLTLNPMMLDTNMNLTPLSWYVQKYYPDTAKEIDRASERLFKTNCESERPSTPLPPPRAEVPPPPEDEETVCLKIGTLILLSDGRHLPVERIRSGDIVLDINLKPSKVVGVNHMFMHRTQFYGFSEGNCFFTAGHIFAHNKSNGFFTVSKAECLKDNPFLDELNITEVQPGQTTEVMKISSDAGVNDVVTETVTVYIDETKRDATVAVYFLIVENETGTYIANGYVCRHALPRFERWPKTLACLQRIFTSDALKRKSIGKELSIMELREIENIADRVAEDLRRALSGEYFPFIYKITNTANERVSEEHTISQSLLYFTTMAEILQNTYWSAFAMLIYGRCGNLVRDVLDNQQKEPVSSLLLADLIIKSIETFAINT